jgi:hypothetical protein
MYLEKLLSLEPNLSATIKSFFTTQRVLLCKGRIVSFVLFKVVGIYRDTIKEEPDVQKKTELQVVFIPILKLTNAEDKIEQVCQKNFWL